MGFWEERMNLDGKVAAVIGGGEGIGAAITLALAAAGVEVAVCDRDGPALETTRRLVEGMGRRVLVETLDALETARPTAWYDRVGDEFDRVDIVVNVVGGVFQRPFAAQHAGRLGGRHGQKLRLCPALDPSSHPAHTPRRGRQHRQPDHHRGPPGRGGPRRVRRGQGGADQLHPGAGRRSWPRTRSASTPWLPTPLHPGNMAALPPARVAGMAAEPDLAAAGMRMYVPMGAPPSPDDIANSVLFLASDLARYVTGTTLHVDGGTYAALGFRQLASRWRLPPRRRARDAPAGVRRQRPADPGGRLRTDDRGAVRGDSGTTEAAHPFRI